VDITGRTGIRAKSKHNTRFGLGWIDFNNDGWLDLYEASGANVMRADEPMQRLWRDVNAARSHAILTWDHAANIYGKALLDNT
jgi:hypothetical protein